MNLEGNIIHNTIEVARVDLKDLLEVCNDIKKHAWNLLNGSDNRHDKDCLLSRIRNFRDLTKDFDRK